MGKIICVSQVKRKFKKCNENDVMSETKSTELLPHNLTDLEEKFNHFQDNILESITKHASVERVSKRQAQLS